ncbi:MAG: M3 family metallopeptidase [Prevotellaceae bacterium]|jgi:peptidyl-dipeptidase Dcp|nr:M3 family metallopeptidase [Prevotellaceae bacterium]
MKKIMLITTAAALLSGCEAFDSNPLLGEFSAPHGATPFDKIKNEHYLPAFKYGMDEGRKEVDAIACNADAPTFENTIAALDYSGASLTRTSGIFFNLNEAETNPEMQQIAREVTPLLTEYNNDITLNEQLFGRIKSVYDSADRSALTTEQATLLEKTYKNFTRNGAGLSEADKVRYRELSSRLSTLKLDFKQHALNETNAYVLNITDSSELKGLPASALEQAKETAAKKGLDGWAFTLHQPSYTPFMKYAENRDLRKQLYVAYNVKGNQGNKDDNNETIREIVNIRLQTAQLLGYKTYADFALEERMAQNTANVNNLLNELLSASKPFAQKEVDEVQACAKRHGADFALQPYDWAFYSEKLREEKYSVNDEALRPYYKLDNVIKGVFGLAEKLYGITFRENKKIPVYHPDVRAYEVYDQNGEFLALYYADLHPREGKRSGAWMNDIRDQHRQNGYAQRPHIINVCNLTKPTDSKPALLTFSEANTILHEFGHALHGMLSDCTYPSLSGTNVYRDFVELPSQIMENWGKEKEFLDMFAAHYETGEKIPTEMIEKIIASQNFLTGYASLRQLTFGMLDMAYHTVDKELAGSIADFEKAAVARTLLLPTVEGASVSTSFGHIFSSGYASGYYSYKWAEVLEADAFSVFKKNGIFDKATAASFRENILSKGGTEHPLELYKRFRGQAPTIDALLQREGFVRIKN